MKKEDSDILNEKDKILATWKEKARRAYVEYRSDLSSKPDLTKLASIFNIKDATRLKDYYVRWFDDSIPAISIVDQSSATIHEARYQKTEKNPIFKEALVLKTSKTEGNIEEKNIYHVASFETIPKDLLQNQLTITRDHRALTFNIPGENSCEKFEVSLEERSLDEKMILQKRTLYSRSLTSNKARTRGGLREFAALSSRESEVWQRILPVKGEKVHYWIQRDTPIYKIWGFVRDIDKTDSTEVNLPNHLIHFTGHNHRNTRSVYFDVYKTNDNLLMTLCNSLNSEEIKLASATRDVLSLEDIDNIIAVLNTDYREFTFVTTLTSILKRYSLRLAKHHKCEAEEDDLLSLDRLECLSIEEIRALVESDIDAYFACAEKNYETLLTTNMNEASKNYTMKPVNEDDQ